MLHAAAGRTGRKLNIRNESYFQQAASAGLTDCLLCVKRAIMIASFARRQPFVELRKAGRKKMRITPEEKTCKRKNM